MERVRTKVVTLRLEQRGRQRLGAHAVIKGNSAREGRRGHTPQYGLGNDAAPAIFGLADGIREEVVEQQVLEIWVLAEGIRNVLQKYRANNAAATPHEGNGWVVQLQLYVFAASRINIKP